MAKEIISLTAPEGKIILEEYIQETPSGMSMPQAVGEPRLGKVYAYGTPLKDDPKVNLKVGDIVCIKKYVSNPLYISELNTKFIFVDYDDITAILVKAKN